jgi:hypothetical protein
MKKRLPIITILSLASSIMFATNVNATEITTASSRFQADISTCESQRFVPFVTKAQCDRAYNLDVQYCKRQYANDSKERSLCFVRAAFEYSECIAEAALGPLVSSGGSVVWPPW